MGRQDVESRGIQSTDMHESTFFKLRCDPLILAANSQTAPIASVWRAFLHLDQTQWWSREKLEQYQVERLQTLLTHCARHVPYYRELFAKNNFVVEQIRSLADYRRLPILTRSTYQDQFDSFVAEELPEATLLTDLRTTSGTSGLPIKVQQTNVVGAWWLAFYLRDLEWCGLDPREPVAGIRTLKLATPELEQKFKEGLRSPSWNSILAPLIEMGPSFGMDLKQDPQRQIEWLLQVQPTYLLSYPSNLDYLATLLRERGTRIPNLRRIQTFAETLDDSVRQNVEESFGVPVMNLYSCIEAGYLASPCPSGAGLHIHAENVILEVLDDNGQPCPTGQKGRVVLTTLRNFATPFLRYEILDDATLGDCSCGRGLPLLTRVDGKRRPNLWLPDGRRRTSVQLVEAFRPIEGIRQSQIIQKQVNHIEIRVATNSSWTEQREVEIRQAVTKFFEAPIQVEIGKYDYLPRSAGGKLLTVINELERKNPG